MTLERRHLRRLVAIILMFAMTAGGVWVLQTFFLRHIDHNQLRIRGFFLEDPDSLDVVVMGSSEVLCDYAAAQAYKETGITSYPFAFSINPVTLWKYELPEILKHQQPKVLVIEMNGVTYDEENLIEDTGVRNFSDNIPLSRNKIALVEDVHKMSRLTYFLPIVKYHGLWDGDQQPKDMIAQQVRGYSLLRGVYSHVCDTNDMKEIETREGASRPLDPIAEESLREFLTECQESGIEHIVFARFPHRVVNDFRYDAYKRYNAAKEIVEEYGFEYVDFDPYVDEIGLDSRRDWFDSEHLNARGQKKFSAFLMKYLDQEYGIGASDLTEEQETEWETSAEYIGRFYPYYEELVEEKEDPDEDVTVYDSYETEEELERRG